MTTEQAEFVLTRTFNAPRVLVWQAWTAAAPGAVVGAERLHS
jgi:uncharacterized protein YndB with AHSA1/START domain